MSTCGKSIKNDISSCVKTISLKGHGQHSSDIYKRHAPRKNPGMANANQNHYHARIVALMLYLVVTGSSTIPAGKVIRLVQYAPLHMTTPNTCQSMMPTSGICGHLVKTYWDLRTVSISLLVRMSLVDCFVAL